MQKPFRFGVFTFMLIMFWEWDALLGKSAMAVPGLPLPCLSDRDFAQGDSLKFKGRK